MAELQNANPTIINLSELPTRRRQKGAAQRGNVELNAFTPRPPHWDKPSSDVFGGHGSETESDGSYAGDPIDEQEIYGTHMDTFCFNTTASVANQHLSPLWSSTRTSCMTFQDILFAGNSAIQNHAPRFSCCSCQPKQILP